MDNKILEIKNLKKIYHDKNGEILSLDDISFSVDNHEFVSIVGPSGCGKSTILGILSNILNSSSGKIIFNKANPKIGYMLQEDALLEWKTVLENCLLGLELNKSLNKKSKEKVLNLLNKYGLGEFINSYPSSLSGGMRQRVV